MVKNLPVSAGDARDSDSIAASGTLLGVGNGNPFQDSCLENPMDREAQWVIVHGVVESWTRLSTHARRNSINI